MSASPTPPSRRISVAAPALVGREREYVLDCIESGWISSAGAYVERFEAAYAEMCGVKHAIACSSGTAALHVALVGLGVGPGDEVIVPSQTFVSTANAVVYCGATPVFCDSIVDTWNIDPDAAERLVGPGTRGIMPVHLYGVPAEMDALTAVAERHGLWLLEDAAEAHGARYKGRRAGSLARAGTFSFYGNKVISTGEGGMVTTDDDELADRVRLLKGQGVDPERRYWFPVIGFNYRMTNVAAAIGVAQIERLDWQLERRRRIAAIYRERLADDPRVTFQVEPAHVESSCWMVTVLLDANGGTPRDAVALAMGAAGIETRPAFPPVHALPPYRRSPETESLPVATRVGERGLTLPTHALLSDDDLNYVADALLAALDGV